MNKGVYNFEPFAGTEEYRTVNREVAKWWVEELAKNRGFLYVENLLDVATGTGTMAELFLDNMRALEGHRHDPPYISSLYLLDPSSEALRIAYHNLVLKQGVGHMITIDSLIEEMPNYVKNINVALWGNGIHYLDKDAQKEAIIRIKRALSPNGWFFFNSAFYDGATPDWTRDFIMAKINAAARELTGKGFKRNKGLAKDAMEFQSPGYYVQLLADCGFYEIKTKEFTVRLYKEALEHICSFTHYAAGALRGYPVEEACVSLKNAVGPSLEKHGKEDDKGKYIKRNWLSVAARV